MKTPDINKILARPAYKACSQYGAQMGRRNQRDGAPEALHLQQLRLIDGDYDTGGAYWGGYPSPPMWCAFSPKDTENDEPIMIFVRGGTRAEAQAAVLAEVKEEGFTFLPEHGADYWG